MKIAPLRRLFREEALRRGLNPRDVDLLIADIAEKPLPWLIAHGDDDVDAAKLESLLARRFAGVQRVLYARPGLVRRWIGLLVCRRRTHTLVRLEPV